MNKARQLTSFLQEFSIPLVIGVVAGLIVANLDQERYREIVDYHLFGQNALIFGHEVTAHFLINSVFMVFFFGVAAKEITDSIVPGGALNPIRRAVNPLMGTLGGILGPAGLYFLLAYLFYGGGDDFSEVSNGWAIPTATDIALAWLVARLVFGHGHPAVNFLLLLAVADDAIGLGIIAGFYPDPHHPVTPVWLLLVAGGMVAAYAMRRMRVRFWLPYIVVGGALSWLGLIKSAIEPALALVVIVPFLPGPETGVGNTVHSDDEKLASSGATPQPSHPNSPLAQFEHHLKPFVDYGLFFFAFANAGAPFKEINSVTWIVLLSLIVGKTVGISLFSAAATKFGFPLPAGMRMKHLAVAGLVAGLGLTVALFVAGKAFSGPPFQDPAKMGAVLSGIVALLALIVGSLLKVKDGAGVRVGPS